MRSLTLVVCIVAAGICWNSAMADNCPTGYPNEILCDDFDTYCATGGGYPGDPKCDPATASMDSYRLREVWPRTSTTEIDDALCGVEVKVEDADSLINSLPFGTRYPKGSLGQATFRDWVLSPPLGQPDQVMDIHRLVQNVFGPEYSAVSGTDLNPLYMEFFMAADIGKLGFSSAYMELAYGSVTDPLNRANTDYALSPDCNTYCNPYIQQLPFPILCAQGSPLLPLPTACPSIATAPLRQAIAIGALSVTDPDPCHCGSTTSHSSQSTHLTLFDGKVWWVLRTNNPAPSTGTVTPRDGAPADPTDIVAGGFVLSSPPSGTKSVNLVTLTITGSTMKVELISRLKSSNGGEYDVYNVMENIPRQYTGPFDRLSMGVGPGCELDSNAAWDVCKAGTDRACLPQRGTYYVDFDDFSLHGGEGFKIEGACCLPDGTCTEPLDAFACSQLGGTYRGPSTTCGDGSICLGACCKGEASGCSDVKVNECPAPFEFQGYGSQCATASCPCSDPFADADLDGDVDQLDFAIFQACFSGPGPVSLNAVCRCFDRDNSGAGDQDVDTDDLARFEACASGPGVPLNPGCDQ